VGIGEAAHPFAGKTGRRPYRPVRRECGAEGGRTAGAVDTRTVKTGHLHLHSKRHGGQVAVAVAVAAAAVVVVAPPARGKQSRWRWRRDGLESARNCCVDGPARGVTFAQMYPLHGVAVYDAGRGAWTAESVPVDGIAYAVVVVLETGTVAGP